MTVINDTLSNAQHKHILIVDDEKDIRSLMQEIFLEEGYQVKTAATGVQARQAWRDQVPDVVFLDVWMPDCDGISLLKDMQQEHLLDHTTVIMMSGHGTIETAVEATRHGAYDFMEKPLSLAKIIVTAERALEHNRLKKENLRFKQAQPERILPIGHSKAMTELRETIERLTKYTMPVLLIGEAGVGKHFFAQALHQNSERQSYPLAHLSAEVFSEQLEYWMGRHDNQVTLGQIEHIKGGTLVISNVEMLSEQAQKIVSTLIFEQGYRRLNSDKLHPIDLRLVCSTQQDLAEFVTQGQFREDLYKRLNVMPIIIPPLRQHSEDISELVTHFMQGFLQQEGLQARHFSDEVINHLRQYSWPGNLRELKNLIQRLLILGSGPEVLIEEVKYSLTQSSQQYYNSAAVDTSRVLKEAKEQFEAAYLKQMLRETCGSMTEAARRSGIERTHLYRKLKTLGIDPKDPI